MSPPRIAALLVDLDGTLADTEALNAEAYAAALAETGRIVAPEHLRTLAHGRSWRDFLPALVGPEGDAAAIAARKRTLYGARVGQAAVNEPLVALLRRHHGGCRTGLVTTAARDSTLRYLARPDLTGLFDCVVTGDDVARHKPDPEAYQRAATLLGVAPESCLVFEDSPAGLTAARRFGARVIRVVHPARTAVQAVAP
ncbi:HAD family hydrolase [Methylobacterium sp. J-090]|uniref:HAD family hydrolase n=1 Tax=Methylobacterium sp. J-090 TaxID=2836666 RepID=UPI001FBBD637|nr:HAD family phosphatase [Methylobacterium sp. J-090]MCJ2081056.1 HAD family phosphatase [Methylobacterium sp. J-090]